MDAPKLCHHLRNEFSFFNAGYTLRGLREATWLGPFPVMWNCRYIWWLGLESLLETSQVPKLQRSPWSGCIVCWAPKNAEVLFKPMLSSHLSFSPSFPNQLLSSSLWFSESSLRNIHKASPSPWGNEGSRTWGKYAPETFTPNAERSNREADTMPEHEWIGIKV